MATIMLPFIYSIIKHFLTSRRTNHDDSSKIQDEAKHLTDDNQKVVPATVRGQNTFVIKIDELSDLAYELEKGVVCQLERQVTDTSPPQTGTRQYILNQRKII